MAFLGLPGVSDARSLKDLISDKKWKSLASYTSQKSALALEMCIGVEMTELPFHGPIVLHGPTETVLASVGAVVAVRIREENGKASIDLDVSSKSFDQRMRQVIERCI